MSGPTLHPGRWPSSAPLGYRNVVDEDGRRGIEPDPERARLVRQIFEWYATGEHSLKEIAGMARQAGFTFRKSGGSLPTPTIHKILPHRIYTGEFSGAGRVYKGSYQPVISKDLYDQVQDVLDGRGCGPRLRGHREGRI